MDTEKISDDINICCPICASRLLYGLEELLMHTKVINTKSGNLQQRTNKRRVINTETRSFLFCENDDCDFIADNHDEQLYGKYFQIFEKINKQDKEDFVNTVKN